MGERVARSRKVHSEGESLYAKLEAIHKEIALPIGSVSGMLARRRLNLAALQVAHSQLKSACETFDKIIEQLIQEGKG